MTVIIEHLTEDEARARRTELLEIVGNEADFRAKARLFALGADERALYDELEALDFLLGR